MISLFWIGHLILYTITSLVGTEGYVRPKDSWKLYSVSRFMSILFFICVLINFCLLKPQGISLIGTYTDWSVNLLFFIFLDIYFLVFKGLQPDEDMAADDRRYVVKRGINRAYKVLRKGYIISIIVRFLLYIPLVYTYGLYTDKIDFLYPLITFPKEDGIESRTKDLKVFDHLYFNYTNFPFKNEPNLRIYTSHLFIFKKLALQTDYYISSISSLGNHRLDTINKDSIRIANVNLTIRKTDSGYNIHGKQYTDSFTLMNVK